MSKIENGGLDQYGAVPFKQQQFRTAGVERVKAQISFVLFAVDYCGFVLTYKTPRLNIINPEAANARL